MYIIENANILRDKRLHTCSLFICNEKISMIRKSTAHDQYMRMNLESYILTPSYVLLSTAFPMKSTFQVLKTFLSEKFLLKGCTTIFTYVELSYENELENKINEMKTALISSPIDFIIGVKIPPRLITLSLIRNCKKLKIPAIFVELKDNDELEEIPWGWIREAMFPFNSPLIPLISSPQKKEARMLLSKWKDIMVKEKITAIYDVIAENQPLSLAVLNKIGLYPHKGSLMTGTELSYNLYLKESEILKVDAESLFHYHSNRLVATVHKGKVIRAGEKVLYSPGSGEYVKVRTPSYFSL
ncbi:hypothetical protein [Neobacillus cucumis]|uniref:Uncharacterized protein n=1 Tax=Neobacillus cucumis TaxID=1740721 RepID=A0A2N5H9E0_9BACI|nr:hypothetical protein [Neobacillus cucumis]PLS02133.1 hypothetical protein CVD27_21550 [Neobacillus cucumis]